MQTGIMNQNCNDEKVDTSAVCRSGLGSLGVGGQWHGRKETAARARSHGREWITETFSEKKNDANRVVAHVELELLA
jgi:hypothetical protein